MVCGTWCSEDENPCPRCASEVDHPIKCPNCDEVIEDPEMCELCYWEQNSSGDSELSDDSWPQIRVVTHPEHGVIDPFAVEIVWGDGSTG